jgi:hypothetical protein
MPGRPAAVMAAMLTGACASLPAPPERAAPSPLCAVDAWDGFTQVRRFRLAPVAFGAERPQAGAELAAACAAAKGETFSITGAEADVANGAWFALGYKTARIRRQSSYLGRAMELDPPPNYDWPEPANAFEILGDITSIEAVSSLPEGAERAGMRRIEVTIHSGRHFEVTQTEILSLASDDQVWHLLDHTWYQTIRKLGYH